MKNRIKTFYEDHKDHVIVILGVVASAAAATALIAINIAEGREIVDNGMQTHKETGQQRFCVTFKNGKEQFFYEPQK